MTLLTLSLRPGAGLGPFTLGERAWVAKERARGCLGASRSRAEPLRPGRPHGAGQSLLEVLELVQRRGQREFRSVEVQYASGGDGANDGGSAAAASPPPRESDRVLAFPEHGFRLLFDGGAQRLRLVEVHDPSRLQARS